MAFWSELKEFARKNNSQSHLAICNTDLFDETIVNGVYGFPHAGTSRKKSFWRSLASMYNIGNNDLIFLYRTNGNVDGCKEIHGPFRVHVRNGNPCIYYDLMSFDVPMFVGDGTDCKVRFMFEKIGDTVYSIGNNFELIKKYATNKIWGYRHPAVMNIGAARKKSVTSFTTSQTQVLLNLFEEFGEERIDVGDMEIPDINRIDHFVNLGIDNFHFYMDNNFILDNYANDEAFYYSHIIHALKNPNCSYRSSLLNELWGINEDMLSCVGIESMDEISANVMLETIITVHLQDELDIVTTNTDDSVMMIYEYKRGAITEDAVRQTESYLDLMSVIYPNMEIFANVVGIDLESGVVVSPRFINQVKLIILRVNSQSPLNISFEEALI